ncbi:MAG TPA: hypothetical protein VNZ22_06620, partial [Bacillota bacterium]|nr:hypothetical protein [Bacillota bacterium]
LLRGAAAQHRRITVTVFEKHRALAVPAEALASCDWRGCNYCAGGISPKLNDVLTALGLDLPERIVQNRIDSLIIQGFWKNIEVDVPEGRRMLAVYRGSRPGNRGTSHSFDSFLLDEALKAGARLVGAEVNDVRLAANGKPVVAYSMAGKECRAQADLVVFAAGVNEKIRGPLQQSRTCQCLRRLIPAFVPPRLRQALIFELLAQPAVPASLVGTVHFVEYGSKELPLEMCSVVPKRNYITVTLVGASVDAVATPADAQRLARAFLTLPHIQKLFPPGLELKPSCACRPYMVVGSAETPFADRIAAVGDLVTSRLYKDGILSACQTAEALARTVLDKGIDAASLQAGYAPTLRRFQSDNGIAALVFLIHRLFFGSSVLSRVLYQAVITERKSTPRGQRHLESILWRIASGDDAYREIFRAMLRPMTFWSVIVGGGLITLRSYLTELCFGLRWEGFGRFTTGVALERLQSKRNEFSRLMADASVSVPGQLDFERMYTIKIPASRQRILDEVGRFGEADREYLRPRGLCVRRVAGQPNTPGCVIRYEVLHRMFCFSLELEQLVGGHLAVYRVRDGFARGGILVFEIEQLHPDLCALSIYVAFNFRHGSWAGSRLFWWCFRHLFPSFVHDVLWNHSLCQLKDVVSRNSRPRGPAPS